MFGANLFDTDLGGANFTGADLSDARDADLTGSELCHTTMTDGSIDNRDC